MTTDRNVDRIVEAWLDVMPSEAPDRAVTAVLEAIATEPQARVFAPALRRSPLMTRLLIVATVAAIAIAGVGGAILIGSGNSTTAPTPQPQPSTSADASLPSALVLPWLGAPRDVPGLGTSFDTRLVLDDESAALTGTGYAGRQFVSDARMIGDTLEVTSPATSTQGPDTCAAGDIGQYATTLAPEGSRLSVEAINDACDARATAFTGEWYRVACKANNTCFGILDAGSYPTVNFGPLLDPAVPVTSEFGQLTYTVPEGWSIASDHISDIRLARSADYALETPDGPPDGDSDGIEAWIRPAAMSPDPPCEETLGTGVERTPEALAAWFADHPNLDAGDPQPITVDGHEGWMIDIGIAPDHTETCGFPRPVVPLLGEDVGEGGLIGDGPYVAGIMAPARVRLIFLDLGNDRLVALLIRAVDPARFEDFVAEAMPIVESFDFN